MDFHQPVGELIDNSLSAKRKASHGPAFEPTVIEIIVEELADACIDHSGRTSLRVPQDRGPAVPEPFLLQVSPASLQSLCPRLANAQRVAAAEMHPLFQVE